MYLDDVKFSEEQIKEWLRDIKENVNTQNDESVPKYNLQGAKEFQNLLVQTKKEAIDEIFARYEINDSFFYGEMLIIKKPEETYLDLYKLRIRLHLHNSKEFTQVLTSKYEPKIMEPVVITKEINIDLEDINEDNLFKYFYEVVSSTITKMLIFDNTTNFNKQLYQVGILKGLK